MKTIYLLLAASFVLCACGDKNDNPYAGKEMASGPSSCKNFVSAEIERLTKEGSLKATRELRDINVRETTPRPIKE
jgi:predicted small secreted protein